MQDNSMFEVLCGNVQTAMVTLNNTLHQFLAFKDELLKHSLPPKLLVNLTLISSRLFRSYSDLCTPVGEMVRMTQLHCGSWEEKAEGMKRIRSDYESMQRRLNIATRRIEMMSTEEERSQRLRRLNNWERVYCKVMRAKSHGRRWKFRIPPLKKKLEQGGFNPYLTDSSSEESGEDEDNDLQQFDSPLDDGTEDELKDLSSGSDEENSDIPQDSVKKRVRFNEGDEEGAADKSPSPDPLPPIDAATSTDEPDYDNYLLVQLYRPNGLLRGKDVCCSLSYCDQYYSSEVFPGKTEPGTPVSNQGFLLNLSDDAARTLPPGREHPLSSLEVAKLTVAVYPRNFAEDMAAHVSLQLRELSLTEEPTVIVPPDTTDEEFSLDWKAIGSSLNAFPVDYELSSRVDSEDEIDTPTLPMVCHRIKVQRHKNMHSGTETKDWKELLMELGYRLIPDSQSRAVSVIHLDDEFVTVETDHASLTAAAGVSSSDQDEALSREQLAELTMKHAEEMKLLQAEYESRLESLSKTLKRVKVESSKEIEMLEQALAEAEQQKGKKARSITEMRNILARKKQRISHGLPEWGKDLSDDFFERLEVFAFESVRKQEELTERIKREVSEACEKRLATQHRLAPGTRKDIDTTTEDVSLPALFMPSSCTKNLVYTPRAHKYFHPPGSNESRITQPPAVFKLPTLHAATMGTLNLFELSQQFSQTSPQWLQEHHHQSPPSTPAPPPSACGFYPAPPTLHHHHSSSSSNIHAHLSQSHAHFSRSPKAIELRESRREL